MKKIAIFLLVFLVTLAGAFAFEVSEVKFGSDSQERDETVSTLVTITNKDPVQNIESITLTFDGDNKYEIDPVTVPVLLVENESEDIDLSAYIPLELDSVDSKGRKIAVDIGNLVVNVTYDTMATDSETVPVYMEAENKLEFGDNRIKIADRSDKGLDDGDNFDEIKRNTNIGIDVEIENSYDENGDICDPDEDMCEIEDIELEFEPDDGDFDSESFDFNDLKADDSDTDSFSFSVPDDADDKKYDFEIWVTGEDQFGALHGEYLVFTLEVEVEDDEVTIDDLVLTPSSLSCEQTHFTLKVYLENTGQDDQDEVSLWVDQEELDIGEDVYDLELDEGDRLTRSFDLTIPEGTEPGNYFIQVTANVDDDEETDLDYATLTIRECEEDIDFPDEDEDDSNTDVNIIEIPPGQGVIVDEEKEPSFFETPQYILLLGGVFLVILLMLFILVVVLLKR